MGVEGVQAVEEERCMDGGGRGRSTLGRMIAGVWW